ncbi:hypothetical protein RSAG8_13717, partial [Rhizoctonia solani AG-8 WAC10335]
MIFRATELPVPQLRSPIKYNVVPISETVTIYIYPPKRSQAMHFGFSADLRSKSGDRQASGPGTSIRA